MACGKPSAPVSQPAGWNAPLAIDDVTLFVPTAWNAGRPWDPRPWPNGLQVGTAGWGQFKPRLGPLEHAGRYDKPPPGQPFRADISAKPPRPGYPDPFFELTATFEYPAPSPWTRTWWGGRRWQPVYPFNLDTLTYRYRAPADKVERPYLRLLAGLRPDDGQDVSSGWHEVRRVYARRPIALRYDATDWREQGGALPRRLAASFGEPFWSHFMLLGPRRWEAAFETQRLPVDQWRARYQTADRLFAWLQTPPAKRNPTERFVWWTDLRFRPAK